YLTPLLQQVFGLTPDAVTGLLLAYGAAGFLSTWVGGGRGARCVPGTAALAALLFATVLSVAALFGDGGPVVATLVTVVWGIAFGLVPISMTGWMLDALPDAPEAGQAMLVTGFQVAVASGALFGGLLVDGHGVVSAMWLGAALSLAAVAVVAASNGTRARRPGLA
ncbi:MAG: MFS transporter, partial [Chitinophagaceae bacterium]|nr:MFS transporter [Rubrivivax sp.]